MTPATCDKDLAMNRTSCSILLAVLATSVLSSTANAENPMGGVGQSTSAAFDECMGSGDAGKGNMWAMITCLSDELSRRDDVLNDTYRSVRKGLAPARQRRLQALERRWIKRRDRMCRAESDKVGGQDGIVVWYGCLIAETDRRTEWLKAFARQA
jgi:uncharacterized protein YecT (DUF1311 family)